MNDKFSAAEQHDVDFDVVGGDPAAYYPDPEAVAADATLSRAQKLRLLMAWAQDLAARQAADNEGMEHQVAGSAAIDATLLERVNAAIAQAELTDHAADPADIRQKWQRLAASRQA